MTANGDYLDRIGDKIYTLLKQKTDAAILRRVERVEAALDELQEDFFTTLAAMIIGSEEAPELGAWTPTWRELSTGSYADKKEYVGAEGFYSFTGKLKEELLMENAITAFGRPLVEVGDGGKYNNQRVYQNPSTGVGVTVKGVPFSLNKLKTLNTSISVDMYPNVSGSIRNTTKGFEGKYLSDDVAIKLSNYRGNRWRPILANYMNWWMEVRAEAAIKKAIQ